MYESGTEVTALTASLCHRFKQPSRCLTESMKSPVTVPWVSCPGSARRDTVERPRLSPAYVFEMQCCRIVESAAHSLSLSLSQDDAKKPCHLTAFLAYKAGMSHIVRDLDRPGSSA